MGAPEPAVASKSDRTSNPATWGLIGVLSGSLISGVFSYFNAQTAYEASENAAIKAQETSERSLEAQRKQAKDDFFRNQRVSAYGKYLSASQWSEIAMLDLLTVIMNPTGFTPDQREFWRSNFEAKYREFVDSGWSLEFFATDELKAVAHELNAELEERHAILNAQYNFQAAPEQFQSLIARMQGPEDRMEQLRTKFTSVASSAVSS